MGANPYARTPGAARSRAGAAVTLDQELTWGADVRDQGVRFRLWAPDAKSVSTVLIGGGGERVVPMDYAGEGWYECVDLDSRPGTRYMFEIDGRDRVPDPAARFAPEGPHGPSEVVDTASLRTGQAARATVPAFEHCHLRAARRHVHARREHTRQLEDASRLLGRSRRHRDRADAARRIPRERAIGATTASCTTRRSHRYGRPDDLRRFIAAAHEHGLAVLLDVVYNHFGPARQLSAPLRAAVLHSRHATPWGEAIDV